MYLTLAMSGMEIFGIMGSSPHIGQHFCATDETYLLADALLCFWGITLWHFGQSLRHDAHFPFSGQLKR